MSCIGALGLSVSCAALALVMFFRYKQVAYVIKQYGQMHWAGFNYWTFVLGLVSAFGGNGVAAFQYHHAHVPHLVFATMFFLGGVVHINLVARMDRAIGTLTDVQPDTVRARTVIAVLSVATFCVYMAAQFVRGPHRPTFQSLAAAFEITTAILFLLFFGTYIAGFNALRFTLVVTATGARQPLHSINTNLLGTV